MVIESIVAVLTPFFDSSQANWFTITVFSLGMSVYGILIWLFSHILAKRDLFKLKQLHGKGDLYEFLQNLFDEFVFLLEYVVVFPIISFIFFCVLSLFLLFLAKDQPMESV